MIIGDKEFRECVPDDFCDDCWREAVERSEKFGTQPQLEYRSVFYVNHIWDGI